MRPIKKTLNLFLFFAIFFVYDFCKLSLAFANHSTVIEALRQPSVDKSRKSAFVSCKGMSSAHTARKVVALTFDDGPHKIYTREVLTILKANGIQATFFFIGKNVNAYPEVVREAYEDGHIIGNHTYSHYHLPHLSGQGIEDELVKGGHAINEVIDLYPLLFRPPYGDCSMKSVRVARNLGFRTIMWSAMTSDYLVDKITSEEIVNDILKLVKPGAIIGLHDGGGNREKTVAALPVIIRALKNQGYKFRTVPELLDIEEYYESDLEID